MTFQRDPSIIFFFVVKFRNLANLFSENVFTNHNSGLKN
jgi:hypothetical protein